jgi:hypothetical protein
MSLGLRVEGLMVCVVVLGGSWQGAQTSRWRWLYAGSRPSRESQSRQTLFDFQFINNTEGV